MGEALRGEFDQLLRQPFCRFVSKLGKDDLIKPFQCVPDCRHDLWVAVPMGNHPP